MRSILTTALASGAAGGGLTAMTKQRQGETRGGRRMRILRNAAMAAALGGGAHAAFGAGVNSFKTALPANDVDPLTQTVNDPSTRALLGAAGVGGAYKVAPWKTNVSGANDALRQLYSGFVTHHPTGGAGLGSSVLDDALSAMRGANGPAGLNLDDLKGALKTHLTGSKARNLGDIERMWTGNSGGAANPQTSAEIRALLRKAGINYGQSALGRAGLGARITGQHWLRPGNLPRNLAVGATGLAAGYYAPDMLSGASQALFPES